MNKKRAHATLIVLCIIAICIINASLSSVSLGYNGDGLVVDLFSNKAPYDGRGINQTIDAFSPFETVVLYALVTYNGDPVATLFVNFQVESPKHNIRVVESPQTNRSGVAEIEFNIPYGENVSETAFGTWTVFASASIAGRYAFDTSTFEVGWLITTTIKTVAPAEYPEPLINKQNFVRGNQVGLNVTLKSITMSYKDVALTIQVYDAMNRPIYEEIDQFKMFPEELTTKYITFSIPQWAATGNATVFAQAYNKEPSAGGAAYSPTSSATFTILLIDVAITRASISSTALYIGQVLEISVTVKNLGSMSETFNVTVYRNSTLIETLEVISLEPNTERTLSFSWNTSGINEGVYTISASTNRVPDEINTMNNNYVAGQVKVIQRRAPISQRDLHIVLWIILLLFLIAILALIVLRRRKKDESEILEQMSYFV